MFLKFSQIPKENTCVGDTFLKSCNPEDSVKKRLQHRCFPVKFAKYLRTPILTEQLQWLLLTFNSYFQRIPERKMVQLLAINTRFSWKKVFAVAKISTSVRKIIPEFIYPFFSVLSFLNFAMKKWFCRVTCFAKIFWSYKMM